MQREENRQEFFRLLQDSDYNDVMFDEESGGVSAVHIKHKYAKQKGLNGWRQGDYELIVLNTLRKSGHRVILEAEPNHPGVKSNDGFIDDEPMEIKSVEGMGEWAISTKLHEAERQNAHCVVLFFPKEELYSLFRINEGIRLYHSSPNNKMTVVKIIVLVVDRIVSVWNRQL